MTIKEANVGEIKSSILANNNHGINFIYIIKNTLPVAVDVYSNKTCLCTAIYSN